MDKKEKTLAANARYSAQVDALLNELGPIDDDRLNRKPSDGGWSAIQTLHHLILAEESSLAYVKKKLSFSPQFEKAGLGAWGRMVLLRWMLHSPFKFKAPRVSGIENIPNSASLADTRISWQKVRGEWSDFFAKMPSELADKAVFRHPRAGRITLLQMLDFFSTHFERHRGQLWRAVS